MLFAAPGARAADESPQTFTLDGTLLAPDRISPLRDTSVKVRVQILDPSKACLLYEEEQTVNTAASDGHFNIQVGSLVGASKRQTMDSGNTMAKVYQNIDAITAWSVPTQTCTGSSYAPAAGDVRYVRVIVTPTSGVAETLSPDMVLTAVPNAVVAQTLQGVHKEGFIQTNPSSNLTQSSLETFMQSLTNGTGVDGGVLSPGSVTDTQISAVDWAKITSVPAGLTAIASLSCTDGKILKMASGNWSCGDEQVPTTDPRLSDSRAPNGSAGGDLGGSYPAPSVAKIQGHGVSVTAPADGQLLRYNNGSSQWEPYNFGIGDLKTSSGTSQFISASCAASQTLIWSSVTNTFSCTTIAINGSQVSGDIAGNAANVTGTVAIANGGTGQTTANAALNALLPSQGTNSGKFLSTNGTSTSWVSVVMTESDPKVGANTTNYLSKWNGSALVTSGIYESGGSMGVGTSSPNASAVVEMASTTKGFLPPRMTTTERDAIVSPAAGLLVYNTTTKKLQFHNGTAWADVDSASGGGGGSGCTDTSEILLGSATRTVGDCTAAGGTPSAAGIACLCQFTGASCPGGWTQQSNWSTTTVKSCTGTGCNVSSCSTGAHGWADTTRELCSYNTGGNFVCSSCSGGGATTCYANITQVGCK